MISSRNELNWGKGVTRGLVFLLFFLNIFSQMFDFPNEVIKHETLLYDSSF